MAVHPLVVPLVVVSIPFGGPTEQFRVRANTPQLVYESPWCALSSQDVVVNMNVLYLAIGGHTSNTICEQVFLCLLNSSYNKTPT